MYHPLCTRTSRGNRALQCVGAPCCTSRTHARRGARARAANVSKLHRRFRCAGGLLCAACVRTDAPMTLPDPFHSVPSTEWPSLAYLWPSLKVPSSELKPVLRCWLLLLPRATRESIAERPSFVNRGYFGVISGGTSADCAQLAPDPSESTTPSSAMGSRWFR